MPEAPTREDVERFRRILGEWDLEAGIDMSLLDPEVVYEDANLPDHVGEKYHGHEGVLRATDRWLENFESVTIRLEDLEVVGERLVSTHHVSVRAHHSGLPLEGTVLYVWTLRDGKVIHFQSFRDRDEAIAAAEGG